MNYKNIFISLIIVLLIATLFISVKKPKMHKVALIYDSGYTIVKDVEPKKEELNIPTVVQTTQTTRVQKKLEDVIKEEEKTSPKQVSTIKKDKQNKTVKKVPVVETKPAPVKEIKKENPKTVKTTKPKEEKIVIQKEVEKPVKIEYRAPIETKTVKQEQPKVVTVTAEQEEILWNIWRSNLQNQIMKDTSLPAIPNGTIFRFSFDVDKFGKITNIQTYSDTRMYTPYAIQYIAPVIRSYQGKSILNFPNGTKRTVTLVKGAWKISNNTRYSTPKDYNDTEVINR